MFLRLAALAVPIFSRQHWVIPTHFCSVSATTEVLQNVASAGNATAVCNSIETFGSAVSDAEPQPAQRWRFQPCHNGFDVKPRRNGERWNLRIVYPWLPHNPRMNHHFPVKVSISYHTILMSFQSPSRLGSSRSWLKVAGGPKVHRTVFCVKSSIWRGKSVLMALWCHQTWLAGISPNWMEKFIGESPIRGPFSIAMFDKWRVRGIQTGLSLTRIIYFHES